MKKLLLLLIIPFLSFGQIVTEDCSSIPDPGMCFAAIEIYYFDQNTGQCEESIWGGCDGLVPFWTLEECQNSCENTMIEQCFDDDESISLAFSSEVFYPYSLPGASCENGFSFLTGFGYSCDSSIYGFSGYNTIGDMCACTCSSGVVGCMNMSGCNYNPEATVDDGSCEYPGDECEGFDLNLQELVYGVLDDDCECGLPLSIDMFLETKKIIKVVNVLGQKSQINSKEKILIHIYNDGSVEKKYLIK